CGAAETERVRPVSPAVAEGRPPESDTRKRTSCFTMKRDEILALLRGYRAELEGYGVTQATFA
ncbi:MAG: hypothetical protein AABY92_09605, partial [Thermodesulfobacteriota bacterium]